MTWKHWKRWKLCLECFNSRATGTLYKRTQGSSLTGLESSWANQRARCFLPEVRNWHGKASIFGQPYSQGVWGLRFVKRTREDQLHRPRCKGFAQAPCPVSRPTGRVHIIGHQSRLHRKSIQSTRISELDCVQSGVKESVKQ